MRAVIQRVSEASVTIDNQIKSEIGTGLMILLGIEETDTKEDIEWLSRKISNMRIFPDEEGVMNRSISDTNGEALVVSQFTLHASTKKGNRPSYIQAAKPDVAIPMYEAFVHELEGQLTTEVKTGEFGADMKVSLINDGPETILIDTKNKQKFIFNQILTRTLKEGSGMLPLRLIFKGLRRKKVTIRWLIVYEEHSKFLHYCSY